MRRALGLLATAVLVVCGLTSCVPAATLSDSSSSRVGDHGFTVAVNGASASGGMAVASSGTAVTLAVTKHAFPGALAKDFVPLGEPVRLRLAHDRQPVARITLHLRVDTAKVTKADWSTPKTYAVLTQSAGSSHPTLLPATYDPTSHVLTAVTSHLSWFQPVQFDARSVLTTAVDEIASALRLRFSEPACAKQKAAATHAGFQYSLDSSWAASSCLSADATSLTVDVSALTGLPFKADSGRFGTVTPLPGISTSGVFSTGIYDVLFGFDGSHLLAPGGQLRFRFAGTPPAKITFTQAPAMLLVAILIETFQTILATLDIKVDALEKLDKADCLSGVVTSAQDAGAKLDATSAGALVSATITCLGTQVSAGPGAVIWAIMTAAPTLLATSILGVVTSLIGKGSFSLTFTRKAEPVVLAASWTSNQQGFGDVQPATVFNGGDGTGLVDHITWSGWGSPTAIGHGTACYLADGQASYQCTAEPATIVASNLGTCNGKSAYEDVGWYFPTKEPGKTVADAEGNDVKNCNY